MEVILTSAVYAADHKKLVELSRLDKHISGFGNMMFSGESAYQRGWIRVATDENGTIVGFTCRRDKTRTPETMLYFILVRPDRQGQGVGRALMLDLEHVTPHKRIALKVAKDNERAVDFYKRLGYVVINDTEYDGHGYLMHRELKHDR